MIVFIILLIILILQFIINYFIFTRHKGKKYISSYSCNYELKQEYIVYKEIGNQSVEDEIVIIKE